MMTNRLPPHVTFPPGVIFQALDDEAVLLDLASERYLILNELGKRMWELLSENGDTSIAVKQLLLEYEVDEDTLHRDMSTWIEKLNELGLVNAQE